MAFNCKLSRNISLNPDGGSTVGGDCGSAEIAAGGISERVFVYNIEDIDNLQFENDMRFDNNLIIETIITSAAYYFIDCTDVSYNENQEGNKHTHTLTLTVSNTQPITEDTINDAVNHRYLVAFRSKGAEHYRVFGWKEGAGMSYTMDMDGDTNAYTITFSDESEYATMTMDELYEAALKEAEEGTVSVRKRDCTENEVMSLDDFVNKVTEEIKNRVR